METHTPTAKEAVRSTRDNLCHAPGCDKRRKSSQYCAMHQARMDRHGSLASLGERRVQGDQVVLTKGACALISEEDAERVAEYTWHITSTGYAAAYERRGNSRFLYMHRMILNAADDQKVDHINANKLDNRRENLRLCTSPENGWNRGASATNTSGYKGVSFDRSKNRWVAQIQIRGEHIARRFKTKIEAAVFYNTLAKEHHGEFAVLNDINFNDPCAVVERERAVQRIEFDGQSLTAFEWSKRLDIPETTIISRRNAGRCAACCLSLAKYHQCTHR